MATISDIVAQKKSDAIQKLADKLTAEQQAKIDANNAVRAEQLKTLVVASWVGYTGLPPSQSELDQWVNLLNQGAPAESLYQYLASTSEYRALQIDRAYLINTVFDHLFGRSATAEELSFWWGAAGDYRFVPTVFNAASGKDAAILSEKITFSQLALPLIGQEDPSSVAYRQLFSYLLDTINPISSRTADDALVALNNVLHPDAPTYYEAVIQPLKEQTLESNLQLAFLAYLRRPPEQIKDSTTDEYDTWLGHLKKTNDDLQFLVQSLVASPEFLQPYYNKDLSGSIADLIQFLFGRAATPNEVNFWNAHANEYGIWLPWYIAQSATGSDKASLNEKLLVSAELGRIATQYNLSVKSPEIKAIVDDLLSRTHVYPGGKTAVQMMAEIDSNLGKGIDPTKPASIESVMLVDDTLSISFTESMDWKYLDKNGDGKISVGSELIVDVKGSYIKDQTNDTTNTPAANGTTETKEFPFGILDVKGYDSGRLILDVNTYRQGYTFDKITQVILIGVRDLDGLIHDVAYPA